MVMKEKLSSSVITDTNFSRLQNSFYATIFKFVFLMTSLFKSMLHPVKIQQRSCFVSFINHLEMGLFADVLWLIDLLQNPNTPFASALATADVSEVLRLAGCCGQNKVEGLRNKRILPVERVSGRSRGGNQSPTESL